MALIICKECGAEVSDKAVSCVKCGCPIKMPDTTISVRASSEFVGFACSYAIYDEDGEQVAKLKPGESYSAKLPDRQVVYSVKLKGSFGSAKDMVCEPNMSNRFSVGPSQSGMSFVVSKVDMFDGRD